MSMTALIIPWSTVLGFFGVVVVANRLLKITADSFTIEYDLLRRHRLYSIKRDEKENIICVLNVHDQTIWRNLSNCAERLIPLENERLIPDFNFLVNNLLLLSKISYSATCHRVLPDGP